MTALPVEPSSSNQSRFLRPAATWETTSDPGTPSPSGTAPWRCPRSRPAPSRPSLRPPNDGPAVATRSGTAIDSCAMTVVDPLAADPLDQVAPVRADVGERPRRAALAPGRPASSTRARREQPVLQVLPVQQVPRPEVAGLGPGPDLAHHRVVAVDERHRRDHAGPRRPAPVIRSASASETASGFSQMTCLPAATRASTYGACVAFGLQTCTTSAVLAASSSTSAKAVAHAPLRQRPRRALRARAEHADQLGAGEQRAASVDGGDHAGADDGDPQRAGAEASAASTVAPTDRDAATGVRRRVAGHESPPRRSEESRRPAATGTVAPGWFGAQR